MGGRQRRHEPFPRAGVLVYRPGSYYVGVRRSCRGGDQVIDDNPGVPGSRLYDIGNCPVGRQRRADHSIGLSFHHMLHCCLVQCTDAQ